MFTALEQISSPELEQRHARCRSLLAQYAPEAGGIVVFSRLNIYHLTGCLVNGVFWLPLEGAPVLMVRRGMERARLESPLEHILPFRSYSDIAAVAAEAGSPLAKRFAVEMSGMSWSLGQLFASRLQDHMLDPGDAILARSRAVKTKWELDKLRLGGGRHDHSLQQLLPEKIHPGMSERDISHAAWEVFFSQGHSGVLRMGNFGEECFLGHVAAGDSANYPSVFNGPVGLRGEHPAVPFMGYAGKIWKKHELLTLDIGFCLEGYATDKTQVYWSGPKSSLPPEIATAHQLCMDIQAWTAENAKPGAIPSELYLHSLQMAEKAGLAEGFMGLGHNKVVFLGHGIGLCVDEFPVLAKGFDEPLEEGMALAIEPKLGIPTLGMVGCENTFEVTPTGAHCITGTTFDILCLD